MKKSALILACLMVGLSSLQSRADEARVLCTAGVTQIPKHSSEYLGDFSTSKADATASAMQECRRESAFNSYCHVMSCFIEEVDSNSN